MQPSQLTPRELHEQIENGHAVSLLDVRSPAEFAGGHIDHPNAETVNVPLGQLQTLHPDQLLDDLSTDTLVTVCASGGRSSFAAQILQRAGIEAANLQGGMHAWNQLTRA